MKSTMKSTGDRNPIGTACNMLSLIIQKIFIDNCCHVCIYCANSFMLIYFQYIMEALNYIYYYAVITYFFQIMFTNICDIILTKDSLCHCNFLIS